MGALEPKTIWAKPKKTEKTLIQKLIGPLIGILLALFLIDLILPKNQQQDDFHLMEELVQKKKWSSIKHLSAVLRLCQQGNEKACKLLDEYPEHRNIYIPIITKAKKNKTLQELYQEEFAKKEISKKLFEYLYKRNFPDLDAIFNKGIRSMRGLDEGLVLEIKWLLLENGYDPTDWQNR